MPIETGATYVFDLGYYDYGWWAKLDAAGCRIVTRLKSNTKLSNVIENAVCEGSGAGAHRNRQGLAHPFERSRRARRGNRRALQAALADRTVLPLGQTDAEDQTFPRQKRERRAHSACRRAHRFPALAPRS